MYFTISNFTPKPHTSFQWHSVSTAEYFRKQELLREAFRAVRGLKVGRYGSISVARLAERTHGRHSSSSLSFSLLLF